MGKPGLQSLNPMATVFVPQKHHNIPKMTQWNAKAFTCDQFMTFLIVDGRYEKFLTILKIKTVKQTFQIIDEALDCINSHTIDPPIKKNYLEIFKLFEGFLIDYECSEILLKLMLLTEKSYHIKFLDKLLTQIKKGHPQAKLMFDILIKHFNFHTQTFLL